MLWPTLVSNEPAYEKELIDTKKVRSPELRTH